MRTNLYTHITLMFAFSLAFRCAFSQGMSVNTTGSSPDGSAMLDVSAANKGALIPRIALSSLTDQTTIPSPATYLTIYNTNALIGNGAGMYYWNNSSWQYMSAPSNGPGNNGQVLTSQGSGQAPQWSGLPQTGGGGSFCSCFNNFQVFGSSGTFTVPANTTTIKVQVWGGGGGGSSSYYSNVAGGGGGGGGYSEGVFAVNAGTSYMVTVGTGGAGGTPGPNNGSQGNPSNFMGTGINITATGGGGGLVTTTTFVTSAGGQGGYGSGGNYNTTVGAGGAGSNSNYSYTSFPGLHGDNGGGSTGSIGTGGGGGGPGGGNGGFVNTAGGNAADNSGAGGGGGGSGTGSGYSGGNGGSGQVMVYY